MSFNKQREEITALCKKLLEDSTVESVVGFQEGGVEGMALPYIFTDPKDAENLVWNERCVPNLSRYLPGRKGKTAILAKPCDARAVISLVAEKQIKREDVHIIGVACGGLKDVNGEPLLACLQCKVNRPPVYDSLIDDPDVPVKTDNADEQSQYAGNLKHFEEEIDKCILCFACRQACYGCYCNTCFMDRGVPNWQPVNPDKGAKMLYHAVRTMHLAGRCVECGACDNACASGVNLRYMIRELTNFVDELYDYRAGMDPDAEPAMLSFTTGDREVGFLGGDAHA